jgi:hypothetical protein
MQMSHAERQARHERSMRLYDIAINMSTGGTILAILGIAFWPATIPGAALIVASMFVSRKAARVSPYTGDAE